MFSTAKQFTFTFALLSSAALARPPNPWSRPNDAGARLKRIALATIPDEVASELISADQGLSSLKLEGLLSTQPIPTQMHCAAFATSASTQAPIIDRCKSGLHMSYDDGVGT